MSPRDRSQWGPRHLDSHQDKTSGTRWALQSDFAAAGIELLCRLARGEMAPRLSLVSSQGFFSVLSPMEFWFLAAVASGLLSWGHLISSNIVDLIEQKLFWTELSWTMPSLNSIMKCLYWKLSVKSCHFTLLTLFSHFDIVQLLCHNLYC